MEYMNHLKGNLGIALNHLMYFLQFLLHAVFPFLYKRTTQAKKMWRYAVQKEYREGMLYPVSLTINSGVESATLEFMEGESEQLKELLAPSPYDETENDYKTAVKFEVVRKGLWGHRIRKLTGIPAPPPCSS